MEAGAFADEHDAGVDGAFSGHGLLARMVQVAAFADRNILGNLL
jgi:hypothetical protein